MAKSSEALNNRLKEIMHRNGWESAMECEIVNRLSCGVYESMIMTKLVTLYIRRP